MLFADKDLCEKKKTFFGDFLASSKKLPASRRIAEALALKVQNQKLDSSLRWHDGRENSDLAKIAQYRERTDTDHERRCIQPPCSFFASSALRPARF